MCGMASNHTHVGAAQTVMLTPNSGTLAAQVLDELQFNQRNHKPAVPAAQLAQWVGAPAPSVRRAIGELRNLGYTINRTDGGYKLV